MIIQLRNEVLPSGVELLHPATQEMQEPSESVTAVRRLKSWTALNVTYHRHSPSRLQKTGT